MPLLGFLALNEIVRGGVAKKELSRSIYISAGITGGICLFMYLFGGVFLSFTSSMDANILAGMPKWYTESLFEQRASMLRSDSLRSLLFILASASLLVFYANSRLRLPAFIATLGVLILLDMWPVNKRYFGEDNWVRKTENDKYFALQPYEKEILKDDSYYRVMNLATNTFNESRTSYRLHSVGGYHAAKLRRYQDLIDAHLSKGNMQVVNMLNTKYLIVPDENKAPEVMINPDAFGPAWVVDEVVVADSPREESDALNTFDLKHKAITGKEFSDFSSVRGSGDGDIELKSYAPDRLVYSAILDDERTAIFSEIYYPYGWRAYIDGKETPHFRANYVLRALNIPAGTHEIVFEFRPDSIYKGFWVNAIFRYIMYGLILSFLFITIRKSILKENN